MTGDWTLPCVQPSGLFPAAEWRSCSSAAPPCGAWENWLWWLRPPATAGKGHKHGRCGLVLLGVPRDSGRSNAPLRNLAHVYNTMMLL